MMRCRLRICKDARGHRVKSHDNPEKTMPYGRDERAAKELQRVYDDYKQYLTEKEKAVVAKYEGREELSGNVKSVSGRQGAYSGGMEGLEKQVRSTRISMNSAITPIGNKNGWGQGTSGV